MKILELRHVDYGINGRSILRNISFSLDERETLVILGSSGSGKSTILKIIMGLIQPDAGQVLVFGTDITRLAYQDLIRLRKRMGIVFQGGALFDSLTVGENVGYYLIEQQRLRHPQADPKVRSMLNMVGLEANIDMMPEELSGGMRRRVAIARTMIYQPELILYDEPTTGLDPLATANIIDLINRLKQGRRVASVVVTHDLEDAAALGDCFAIVREGELAWTGSRSAFLASQAAIVGAFYR